MRMLFAFGPTIRPSSKPKRGCPAMRSCCFLGRHLHHKSAGQGHRKIHHRARGALDPRRHPPPPRQNQSVESSSCGARGHRGVDKNGTSGEAWRSRVESGPHLPRSQQGVKVMGVPTGQPRDSLEGTGHSVSAHFRGSRILWPLSCFSSWLRAVQPDLTEGFAERHDKSGAPSAPEEAQVLAALVLFVRGLGLSSALRVRRAADELA